MPRHGGRAAGPVAEDLPAEVYHGLEGFGPVEEVEELLDRRVHSLGHEFLGLLQRASLPCDSLLEDCLKVLLTQTTVLCDRVESRDRRELLRKLRLVAELLRALPIDLEEREIAVFERLARAQLACDLLDEMLDSIAARGTGTR